MRGRRRAPLTEMFRIFSINISTNIFPSSPLGWNARICDHERPVVDRPPGRPHGGRRAISHNAEIGVLHDPVLSKEAHGFGAHRKDLLGLRAEENVDQQEHVNLRIFVRQPTHAAIDSRIARDDKGCDDEDHDDGPVDRIGGEVG